MAKDDGWVYYYKNGHLVAFNTKTTKKNNVHKLTKKEREEWDMEVRDYDAYPTVYIDDKSEFESLRVAIMQKVHIFKQAEPLQIIDNGPYKYAYVLDSEGSFRVVGRKLIDNDIDEWYEE